MRRLTCTLSLASVAVWMCSGCCSPNTPCTTTKIGPSTGEVVGAIVGVAAVIGVGTAVLIHVEHTHHYIKGCVFDGPNGLEIQDAASKKNYALAGGTPYLKAGELVRVHGDRVKKAKGSTAEQAFTVAEVKKNYGACTISPPPGVPTPVTRP